MSESELRRDIDRLEDSIHELKKMGHELGAKFRKAQGPTLSGLFSLATGRSAQHSQNVIDDYESKLNNVQNKIREKERELSAKRSELASIQWQKN